jgi:hypothetical protein
MINFKFEINYDKKNNLLKQKGGDLSPDLVQEKKKKLTNEIKYHNFESTKLNLFIKSVFDRYLYYHNINKDLLKTNTKEQFSKLYYSKYGLINWRLIAFKDDPTSRYNQDKIKKINLLIDNEFIDEDDLIIGSIESDYPVPGWLGGEGFNGWEEIKLKDYLKLRKFVENTVNFFIKKFNIPIPKR